MRFRPLLDLGSVGRAATANDPPTAFSLLAGLAVECMLDTTQIPDDLRQQYYATDDGSADWGTWHLRWFVEEIDGSNHFFVRLTPADVTQGS